MLPQLDSSYYISQFFWLSVCFGILIFAFKKVFIPRMNALIDKRDSAIEKGRENVAILTEEISKLEQEISNLKNLELKRSAEIIKEASRKSEKILSEQLSTLKKENEELEKRLSEYKSQEKVNQLEIDVSKIVLEIIEKHFEAFETLDIVEKKNLLRLIVDNVVGNGDTVEINLLSQSPNNFFNTTLLPACEYRK